MGIYIEFNETHQPRRSSIGITLLKKMLRIFEEFKLFETESILIWEGYPLKSLGGKFRKIQSIDHLNRSVLIKTEYKDDRIVNRVIRTVEIKGFFYFIHEGEQLRLPGQILFTGDEISKDLPDVYIDTFTYMGMNFIDFLRGKNNYNKKKVIKALHKIYKQKDITGIDNIDFFIGESPESVKLLHECQYIRVKSMNWFLFRFLAYVNLLQKEKMKDMPWFKLTKGEIIGMYDRMNYIRPDFIPKATQKLSVHEEKKDTPIEELLRMRTQQFAEVTAGSLTIIDREFDGKNIQDLLNELLQVFSEVVSSVFRPRREVEAEFVEVFQKIVKGWS